MTKRKHNHGVQPRSRQTSEKPVRHLSRQPSVQQALQQQQKLRGGSAISTRSATLRRQQQQSPLHHRLIFTHTSTEAIKWHVSDKTQPQPIGQTPQCDSHMSCGRVSASTHLGAFTSPWQKKKKTKTAFPRSDRKRDYKINQRLQNELLGRAGPKATTHWTNQRHSPSQQRASDWFAEKTYEFLLPVKPKLQKRHLTPYIDSV